MQMSIIATKSHNFFITDVMQMFCTFWVAYNHHINGHLIISLTRTHFCHSTKYSQRRSVGAQQSNMYFTGTMKMPFSCIHSSIKPEYIN